MNNPGSGLFYYSKKGDEVKYQIPLFRSAVNEADVQAVSAVMTRANYWAEGPEIEQFETKLCQYMGVPGALVCNSGTSALHMAMIACGVRYFHEVIVPSFTFISTVNAVKFTGAEPVFADIEPDTMGLDPADVESKITQKTKAIIAVHYAGHPCRITELRKLAFKHDLVLIEDAAEAMGAVSNNRMVGTFGHCSMLSFCQNKIISTGEGGALITDTKWTYDRARLVRSHDRQVGTSFDGSSSDYIDLGYNFRIPTMNAALGISQLSRIEELITKRERVAGWYFENLKDTQLTLPCIHGSARHVYQLYTIRVPNGQRDKLMAHLAGKGIASKIYFNPVHLTAFYRKNKDDVLPVTNQISKEVLTLPMYPDLKEEEVKEVCEAVKEGLC